MIFWTQTQHVSKAKLFTKCETLKKNVNFTIKILIFTIILAKKIVKYQINCEFHTFEI